MCCDTTVTQHRHNTNIQELRTPLNLLLVSQHSKFFVESKSLKPGDIVVCADFSENYAIAVQDAA